MKLILSFGVWLMQTKNYKYKKYFKVTCFGNHLNTQILTLGKSKLSVP
jgi:hypothetical protein